MLGGDRGWRFVRTSVGGGDSEFDPFWAILEETAHFGFQGRGEDVASDAAFNVDGAIGLGHVLGGRVKFGAKEEVASIAASGTGF